MEKSSSATLHFLGSRDSHGDWRREVREVLHLAGPNCHLLLAYDRGPINGLRRFRGGEGVRGQGGVPPPRSVIAFLTECGAPVVNRFGVWPSVKAPRIGFRFGSTYTVAWFQQTGMWGGGGRSPLLRALARRFPGPGILQRLTPGIALVCDLRDESGP